MSWYRLIACLWIVTLVLPVASGQSANSLSVMTFNVWGAEGSQQGRDKLVEIIQAAEADIVGLQEIGNSAGQSIADALGFHYHQQSGGGIQIVSRYPIIGQSPSNRGAQIELSPGQSVWLFNAHLAAYPYQPYDLRDDYEADGELDWTEADVIAAANAARGGQVTGYLDEMAAALESGQPVFLTGDFNEPSHLDWTQAVADATTRPFDLQVEYPASKRITDTGLIDSFRAVRPDVVNDRAYTWTPGYPPPNLTEDEVHDRIDMVYHSGAGVTPVSAATIGLDDSNPNTDIAVPGYNSDHRAVVVTFEIPDYCFLPGDLNGDCMIDVADWQQFRSGQHTDLTDLSREQAYEMGDLNGDFVNNHADFVLFKQAYESANGPGSFAQALTAVPEPAAAALAACAACVALRRKLSFLRWFAQR